MAVAPQSPGPWRALRGWILLAAVIGGVWAVLHFVVLRAKPVKVRVVPVTQGIVEWTVTNTKAGSVRARRTADLSSEAPGRIVAILRREGDRITAGEPVIRLDARATEAALVVADRELSGAKAADRQAHVSRDDAARELQRLAGLFAKGTVAEADHDRAKTALALAEAADAVAATRVAQAEARLAQIQVELARLTVAAPFDGVVAERLADVGEWATPGQPLLRCLAPEDLYVRADLDEVDIAHVRAGLACRVTLDAWRDLRLPGTITRVAPLVAEALEQSRTLEIEVAVRDVPATVTLRPGLSADVEVILEATGPQAVRVPASAVTEGDAVLVVEAGVARRRTFTAGLRNWEFVEVRDGLKAGDTVIVSLDRDAVRDGAQVTIEAGTPERR